MNAPRDPDCELCNDTGLVARWSSYPCSYAFPGPVPRDARNVYEGFCDCKTGVGMLRNDRNPPAGDERSSHDLGNAEAVINNRDKR